MKKKITILFSNAHLSYSPTVLGLYDLLSEHFDVTILAQNQEAYNNKLLSDKQIVYRSGLHNKNLVEIYRRFFDLQAIFNDQIKTIVNLKFPVEVIYDFRMVSRYFNANKPDFIIAVDFKSLFYAQLLSKNVEFLSLEIPENDVFYAECDFKNIKSVTIQTVERYEYLFKKRKFKTFYIQNAPTYQKFSDEPERKNLIFCGTAWNPFGFHHCLEFLKKYSEYKMHVKGSVSDEEKTFVETNCRDLLAGQRLIIEDEYLEDGAVVGYLRQFTAGFCFYNFEVEWIDTFNYYSAPSGKMFKYMAAGVPVIGQNIPGLHPVKEFDCGVLIEDLTPESIRNAVEKVADNFDHYSRNCLRAAQHYSFDKNAEPFVNYLSDCN